MKIVSADFVKSCLKPAHYPREQLPEVAFVGRSNVGKSSAINSLLNRKAIAKVSTTPGKTQTLNFLPYPHERQDVVPALLRGSAGLRLCQSRPVGS